MIERGLTYNTYTLSPTAAATKPKGTSPSSSIQNLLRSIIHHHHHHKKKSCCIGFFFCSEVGGCFFGGVLV
jgi:hypothetical protein